MDLELRIEIPEPHPAQAPFVDSQAPRKIIRAGRRGGKTVGVAILAVERFLDGRRVLYAAPTSEQIDTFWNECKRMLSPAVEAGVFYKNETSHIIERAGTDQRIRAKTAWNADTLRGDHADLLILDEWQLMNEEAWTRVGAPMLLDNDGDAVFIYTPPSLESRSVTKADDPQHAAKLFKKALRDDTGRWEAYHFRSHDNPHISRTALADITHDMSELAYRQEILAEDLDEVPGALWTYRLLDDTRVTDYPDLHSIVVAVDPHATTGTTGIVVVGAARVGDEIHGYVIDDVSAEAGASPSEWGALAVAAYNRWRADAIVAEINNGGDMVENVIRNVPGGRNVPYKVVRATRGKHTRAQPVSTVFEQGRGHMVGSFKKLEDQLCTWRPGDDSPDRLDAMVWGFTELVVGNAPAPAGSQVDIDTSAYKPQRRESIWD